MVLGWGDHGLPLNSFLNNLMAATMDVAKATLSLETVWLVKMLLKGCMIDANVLESILGSSYLLLVRDSERLSFLALCPASRGCSWSSCPPPWVWASP